MKKELTALVPFALALGLCLTACDNGGSHNAVAPKEDDTVAVKKVDYSLGRAMNKRLGKGINLGNSWDSQGGA